ncbi:MAG: sigma-70 family RNA polymerase sigma factor, partial [Planctomycetota bacterium]
ALCQGDADALTELYDRHGPVVYRMALRTAGQAQDAADATQEAFLHLLDVACSLRLSGKLSSYLYPVVTRLARRARERAGRHTSDAEAFKAAAHLAEEGRARSSTREELAEALGSVSDTQREILLLRFADGLTVSEAAVSLNIPEATVRSRTHAAVAALRAHPSDLRDLL